MFDTSAPYVTSGLQWKRGPFPLGVPRLSLGRGSVCSTAVLRRGPDQDRAQGLAQAVHRHLRVRWMEGLRHVLRGGRPGLLDRPPRIGDGEPLCP